MPVPQQECKCISECYDLASQVTEDQLRAIFLRFGEIVYVKIPAGKGCGFVQFMGRPNAEAAMLAMNGQVLLPCPMHRRHWCPQGQLHLIAQRSYRFCKDLCLCVADLIFVVVSADGGGNLDSDQLGPILGQSPYPIAGGRGNASRFSADGEWRVWVPDYLWRPHRRLCHSTLRHRPQRSLRRFPFFPIHNAGMARTQQV